MTAEDWDYEETTTTDRGRPGGGFAARIGLLTKVFPRSAQKKILANRKSLGILVGYRYVLSGAEDRTTRF